MALKPSAENVSTALPTTTECDVAQMAYFDFTQSDIVRYAFVIAYVIVICLSLLGNTMVIWTVYRNKRMRTVTNYYIVNLAVCDFLVAGLVMPLKLVEYTMDCEWSLFTSDLLCSFVYFILPVFVFASVLTLVSISVERFIAIVRPLNAKALTTKSRTRRILILSWLVAFAVSVPYLFCRSYAFNISSQLGSITRRICTDRFDDIDDWLATLTPSDPGNDPEGQRSRGSFRKGFFLFLIVGMYVLPVLIIVYTCVHMSVCLLRPADVSRRGQTARNFERNKRRIVRVIIAVATSFLTSWAPFYLVSFISQMQEESFLRRSNFLLTMLSTHLAGFINSCVNPFLYSILCDSFRSSFRQILATLLCRRTATTFGRRQHLYSAGGATSHSAALRVSWRTSGFYKASYDGADEHERGFNETSAVQITIFKRGGSLEPPNFC